MSDQQSGSARAPDDSDRPLLSDAPDLEGSVASDNRVPQHDEEADETTPLIPNNGGSDAAEADDTPPWALWTRWRQRSKKQSSSYRWPTILSLVFLCLAAIAILCLGFALPEAMQEYAEQAAAFEPTKLSIDSFTANGINARVQGEFFLDGSRVNKKPVRDLGRFGTWIARSVQTENTTVAVSLPEYNIDLGTIDVPSITVSVVDGKRTPIDIIANITPGKIDGLRHLAEEWLDGRLGQLRLQGKANVGLRSGFINFGTQKIIETLTFEDDQVPDVPEYEISRLNIYEIELPEVGKVMSADVKISAFNKHPISFSVPPMAFDILIPGCSDKGHLMLANATTSTVSVEPNESVDLVAQGIIRQLSPPVVSTCPGSDLSPLDSLLGSYIHGDETTLYVRGSKNPGLDTPKWLADLLHSVTVAVPISGHSMGKLLRNFTMEDTQFDLPNPLADPNSPEAQPRVSALIKVFANVPEEMNFPINVSRVKANADVLYDGKPFGILQIKKWQNANSTRIDGHDGAPSLLAVEAELKHAPLSITDQDVFTTVIQEMLFGDGVMLDVHALVDVEISSVLGEFAVREIPANGSIPLKPLLKDGGLGTIAPSINNLSIVETQAKTLSLSAVANVTNPTKYSANVPFVNIHLLSNGTILGNATATEIQILPGPNEEISIRAIWDPVGLGGKHGPQAARDFLSSFISGRNTTLTLRTHAGSIPSLPGIGEALSKFEFDIPAPKLKSPSNPKEPDEEPDDKPHFIDDATMHLVSSTADFVLLSPLRENTIYLTKINATAIYNGTEPVGKIYYDLPIAIPPGPTKTPRLPVDWSLGSVGYDAVRDALGGTLKLGAKAVVGVRVGQWVQTVDFEGAGIGAHIQL